MGNIRCGVSEGGPLTLPTRPIFRWTSLITNRPASAILMQELTEKKDAEFVDRRQAGSGAPGVERRQFSDAHNSDNPDITELGKAIDKYKLENRRRFITIEELYNVISSLGYKR